MSILHSTFTNFAPFFILLGILIFVHELGHFLVAKYFGVRVEVFSLGFGKKILSFRRGDTNYCLSIIPLGGYVKMYGDDPSGEIPEDQKKYAFLHKPIPQRFAVVLAGPLMNLIFAFFIFSVIVGIGEEVPGPFVGDVAADTKAFNAGFRSGDKIVGVSGEDTPTWSSVNKKIEAAGGKVLEFRIERKGEAQPLQFQTAVEYVENENMFSAQRQVGQISGLTQESRSTLVGVRDPNSPAAKAGINTLDLITSVNGNKVQYWRELEPALLEAVRTGKLSLQLRNMEFVGKAKKPKASESDAPADVRTVEVALPKTIDSPLKDLGLEPAELFIFQTTEGSPADKAGILAKDKVLKVGSETVTAWNDVLNKVRAFDPTTDGMDFVILRSGEEKSFHVKPQMTKLAMNSQGKEEQRFTIGITSGYYPLGADSVFYRITNPIQILKRGLEDTYYWTEFIVMGLVRMVQLEVSPRNLGGVITIGRVASHSFAAGLTVFLKMMGLISINLFLINLLPVPILDGGHLVFYTIEALRGAPLSMRKMEIAQQVGLMLLMFLMAFAFFNDISNLFSTKW